MSKSQVKPSRRGFMLGAAAASAATVAVVTLPRSAVTDTAPVTATPPAPSNGGGYHVSDHVKRYYKTARV